MKHCNHFLTILHLISTGFGHHADYVFGWKGDALQKAMDARCDVYDASPDPLVFPASGCPQLRTQDVAVANQCNQQQTAPEDLDACKPCFWCLMIEKDTLLMIFLGLPSLPGGMPITWTWSVATRWHADRQVWDMFESLCHGSLWRINWEAVLASHFILQGTGGLNNANRYPRICLRFPYCKHLYHISWISVEP